MNKEAIKLVEEAKTEIEHLTPAGVAYPLYEEKISIKKLDQVLALLTEQPPVSEFTKRFRAGIRLRDNRDKCGDPVEVIIDIKLINEACTRLGRSEASREDYERRLKAHSAGEAVKGFCRACQKPFWNVDDEDITCPFCGWKGFPVPDIDAEQIA